MKTAVLTLLVLAVATTAWAADPIMFRTAGPTPGAPAVDETVIWMQPPSTYWMTFNASTPFTSESADDLPNSLAGQTVNGVLCYALEWGAYAGWQNPAGIYVNLYYSACPPALVPDATFYFPWGSPQMETTLAYSDGYSMYAYETKVWFCGPFQPFVIEEGMSIGFQLDLPWGMTSPYGGVVETQDYAISGCEGYWAGAYWGYPRWTHYSVYWGSTLDVAYGLLQGGASATEQTTWSSVKALYQ